MSMPDSAIPVLIADEHSEDDILGARLLSVPECKERTDVGGDEDSDADIALPSVSLHEKFSYSYALH